MIRQGAPGRLNSVTTRLTESTGDAAELLDLDRSRHVPQLEYSAGNGSAHAVQFYDADTFLVAAVARFIATALAVGEAGVVIGTNEHRESIAKRLQARGIDLSTAEREGRYVSLDAAETLARCMIDGRLDATSFSDVVGGLIARAAAAGRPGRLRAFGEMVALLCADGNVEGAVRLEELWNDLAKRLQFSLLCAYPIGAFRGEAHAQPFLRVCAEHSRVIPAESYTAVTSMDERLRTIAQLQRKARALEAETAERKRAEEELKRRLEQLAEADRRKDEFLAMLGHELRNPLSAIRNALVSARLDASRRDRALEIACRQADQLGRLVDDLLDMARITRGTIKLRTRRVRFPDIVARAVETARQLIEERAHSVTLSLPDDDDLPVEADPPRLEQVIVNLVSNAARYTPPGGCIEIVARRDAGEAVLRVRDDGVGIAPEMLSRVFDLFAQADRALDRAQGGLGIGLTVVRRLVELHGGRVEAGSAGAGKGAEFVVRLPVLPLTRLDAVAGVGPEAIPERRARVLVVEDNVDAAESLVMLLELFGHDVWVVHDGGTAITMAQRHVPDLMLIDIGLPGMDGYELARRIRCQPELDGVRLAALTGYGREEDRQRALAAGFEQHLAKPIEISALRRLLVGDAHGAGIP